MEKIPDYRIREEEEEETQESLRSLCERMREHRLSKAQLYRQEAPLSAQTEEEPSQATPGGWKVIPTLIFCPIKVLIDCNFKVCTLELFTDS